MASVVLSLLYSLRFIVRSRAALHLEIIALRHQLAVVNRSRHPRLRFTAADRILWAWLSRAWSDWRATVHIVKPETDVSWHRRGFRLFWTWKSRLRIGRPIVPHDVRTLIREMSTANPLWGAPRIHGELLKLGFNVAQSTVSKYMLKRRGPPSQGWKTFLRNHADGIASVDFLIVPTLAFERLFVFVILGLGRRRLLWIAVTTNPTAEWLGRQITEAFPWDTIPGFIIRDNDGAYGEAFTRRLRAMGIRDRPIAPRSPWQNGYVERSIGSIRRECLDHVIIWGEAHLRQVLKAYTAYYNATRTHLGIDKDAPNCRPIESCGVIVANAVLGGLHHRYARI